MDHRIRGLVLAAPLAAAVGAISAVARQKMSGHIHWEAIAAFCVLLPALCLWLTLSRRQIPWRRAVGWLVLDILVTYLAFAVAWSLVFGRVWDDFVGVVAAFSAVSLVSAPILLIVWQVFRPVRSTGPFCPGCRYCLIGTAEDRCPECGRPFTPEQLGISRQDLQPTSRPPEFPSQIPP